MANTKSAIKRIRTSEKRRLRNRTVRSRVRSVLKTARAAVTTPGDEARAAVLQAIRTLDKAVTNKRTTDGAIFYRGEDVFRLAVSRSFEEVAEFLWVGEFPETRAWESDPATVEHCTRVQDALPPAALPLDRLRVGVATAGTRPNVVAAHARAEIDVRFTRASEAERVVTAIQGLQPRLEGARLRISGGVDRPPMERSPGVIRLAQLAQRLAGDVGFSLTETSTGGASDGNFTAAMGVPTLDGLGPDGGGAHADSEHLLVESWLQRTQLLRLLIEAL